MARLGHKPRGSSNGSVSRRRFLHSCVICSGAIWAGVAIGSGPHDRGSDKQTEDRPVKFSFFDPQQVATVEAICEQIIPEDDLPGARWAGVVHYIDVALATDARHLAPLYVAGIRATDKTSRRMFGRRFHELEFAQQTEVLRAIESGKVPRRIWGKTSSREFFEIVRRQTMEGFYCHPKYGGNRERISWKMLGFQG